MVEILKYDPILNDLKKKLNDEKLIQNILDFIHDFNKLNQPWDWNLKDEFNKIFTYDDGITILFTIVMDLYLLLTLVTSSGTNYEESIYKL